jgi:hypothetical protein
LAEIMHGFHADLCPLGVMRQHIDHLTQAIAM